MIQLLADVNIEGQVARLAALMQGNYWREFWDYLDLHLQRFSDVGLTATDTDAVVWAACQQHQLYLITNNRNDDGPDSLEATIRAQNTTQCLPVFTLSAGERVMSSKDYAERVVESLFDQLMRIETLRGTGRLYLP